ncbi:MAG: FAD-dependent oxidoreductase [Pyrinomonadaceae bacterium]
MDRDQNLKRVAERTEPWDIVVIGGGATGAGCVMDAASRGLSVLLLEQHDFGKGTSSRSTKLIHGGVRYLRQGNISLVRESLRERGLLLRNAPHVVHKLEFVIPCYSRWEKIVYGFGLKVYDLLATKYSIGRSRILDRNEVLKRLPNIESNGLKGGVVYYDGQFDDSRLLIDILRTAESSGAVVLNYAWVLSLRKDENGNVCGVEFVDVETDESLSVRARVVINATGAFCSAVQKMSEPAAPPIVTYSQGVHIVLDRTFMPGDCALMIPKTSDGRVLFCIPWQDHVLVGTTDTPVNSLSLEPKALGSEIDFILETAGKYLSIRPSREDILSVFAGIRPLISKNSETRSSSLSRDHDLFVDDFRLVTITGGKWTTFRKMAEDAVDKALEIAKLESRKCVTADLAIMPPKTNGDKERLDDETDLTRGGVVRAISDEMARTVEDVLARRARTLFLNAQIALDLAPKVADIMAEQLGRDEDWVKRQIEEFRSVAVGYLQSGSRD